MVPEMKERGNPQPRNSWWRGLILPIFLTLFPLFVLSFQARRKAEENEFREGTGWLETSEPLLRHLQRAASPKFWCEEYIRRFRTRVGKLLSESSPKGVRQPRLGEFQEAVNRAIAMGPVIDGWEPPKLWVFHFPGSPGEKTAQPCRGQGLQNSYLNHFGKGLVEIRNGIFSRSGNSGGERLSSWIRGTFGPGCSGGLFSREFRGCAFPVIFFREYGILVWEMFLFRGKPVGGLLAVFPGGPGRERKALETCMKRWQEDFCPRGAWPGLIPFPRNERPFSAAPMLHPNLPGSPAWGRMKSLLGRMGLSIAPRTQKEWYRPENGITLDYCREFFGMVRLPGELVGRPIDLGEGFWGRVFPLPEATHRFGILIGKMAPSEISWEELGVSMGLPIWGFAWAMLLVRFFLFGRLPEMRVEQQLAFWFLLLLAGPMIFILSNSEAHFQEVSATLREAGGQRLSGLIRELEGEFKRIDESYILGCRQAISQSGFEKFLLGRFEKCPENERKVEMGLLFNRLVGDGLAPLYIGVMGVGRPSLSFVPEGVDPTQARTIENAIGGYFRKLARPDGSGQAPRGKATGTAPISGTGLGGILGEFEEIGEGAFSEGDYPVAQFRSGNRILSHFHKAVHLATHTEFVISVIWDQNEAFQKRLGILGPSLSQRESVQLGVFRKEGTVFHLPPGFRGFGFPAGIPDYSIPGKNLFTDRRTGSLNILQRSRKSPEFVFWIREPGFEKLLRSRLGTEKARIVVSLLGSFLGVFLIWAALRRWLTDPIVEMTENLRRIASGNLESKIPFHDRNELGRAGRTLDSMRRWLIERMKLSRFVAPQVLEAVAGQGPSVPGEAEFRQAVVLVSDIRDFTTLSERHAPERIFRFLNEHRAIMLGPIQKAGGIVDRFVGDAIQAVFYEKPGESPLSAALEAAREMVRAQNAFSERRSSEGSFPYRIGVGLAYGKVLTGVVGDPGVRLDFSVLGETVQEAADLEAASKGGVSTRIVCSREFLGAVPDCCGFEPVTGRDEAWELFDPAFSSSIPAISGTSLGPAVELDGSDSGSGTGHGNTSRSTWSSIQSAGQISPSRIPEGRPAFMAFLRDRAGPVLVWGVILGLFSQFRNRLSGSWEGNQRILSRFQLQQDLQLVETPVDCPLQVSSELRRILREEGGRQSSEKGPSSDGEHLDSVGKRLEEFLRGFPNASGFLFERRKDAATFSGIVDVGSNRLHSSFGVGLEVDRSDLENLVTSLEAHAFNLPMSHALANWSEARCPSFLQAPGSNLGTFSKVCFGQLVKFQLRGEWKFLYWEPLVLQEFWEDPRSQARDPNDLWGWDRNFLRCRAGYAVLIFDPSDLGERSGVESLIRNLRRNGTEALFQEEGTSGKPFGSTVLARNDGLLSRLQAGEKKEKVDGWEWSGSRAFQGGHYRFLLARRIGGEENPYLLWEGVLNAFLFVWGVGGACILSRLFLAGGKQFLSLRFSLPMVFLLAIVPILGQAVLTGEEWAVEHQHRLLMRSRESALGHFKSIEEFARMVSAWQAGLLSGTCNHRNLREALENDRRTGGTGTERELEKTGDLLFRSGLYAQGIMVGGMGEFLRLFTPGKNDKNLLLEMISRLVCQGLGLLSREEAGSDTDPGQRRVFIDAQIEEIRRALEGVIPPDLLAATAHSPELRFTIRFGTNSLTFFLKHLVFRGKPNYVFHCTIDTRCLAFQILATPGLVSSGTETEFQPLRISEGRRMPCLAFVPPFFCPITRENDRDLSPVFVAAETKAAESSALSEFLEEPVFRTIGNGARTLQIVSQSCPELGNLFLTLTTPVGRILERFGSLNLWQRTFNLITLLICFLLATVVASRFLEPVIELGQASEEVMHENFRVSLPTGRGDEFGNLATAFNSMVEGVREGRLLRRFVSVSATAAAADAGQEEAAGRGEMVTMVVLFAGLKGFKELVHGSEPRGLVHELNRHLETMSREILSRGGDIDKFIGDKILAVFDPRRIRKPGRALTAALEAAAGMKACFGQMGLKIPVDLGIGMVAGPVLSGIIGTPGTRLEFTVIGDTVNLAARLCELALKQNEAGTLVEAGLIESLRNCGEGLEMVGRFSPFGDVAIKGKSGLIRVFRFS